MLKTAGIASATIGPLFVTGNAGMALSVTPPIGTASTILVPYQNIVGDALFNSIVGLEWTKSFYAWNKNKFIKKLKHTNKSKILSRTFHSY